MIHRRSDREAAVPASAAATPTGSPRWRWWWAHLVLVVLLIAGEVAIVAATPAEDGFNFAVVLVAGPLTGLGLPWSLLQVLFPYVIEDFLYGHLSRPVAYALLYVVANGPALINVAIHAAVLRHLRRRRRGRLSTT